MVRRHATNILEGKFMFMDDDGNPLVPTVRSLRMVVLSRSWQREWHESSAASISLSVTWDRRRFSEFALLASLYFTRPKQCPKSPMPFLVGPSQLAISDKRKGRT
uniref:Uncharacterized protein n=1 Tax=Tanacetum cinerariifolium TaxID=118510 RepID=A0A6L2JJZ4_TANCI|nr:hypothetical protein [Tanacetum cinerariifolium]